MKPCSKRRIEKELSEFYKSAASKTGFHSACKECENLAGKKRVAEFRKGFEAIEIPMNLNKFINLKLIQNNTPVPKCFLQRKVRIHYTY